MKARLKASKGTHDLFPPESEKFAAVESTVSIVLPWGLMATLTIV